MDHVIDSESCADCGHDHYPYGAYVAYYSERRPECCEPGCDCASYKAPERLLPRVYRCSRCSRMVTRVWRTSLGQGQQCDDCYHDD